MSGVELVANWRAVPVCPCECARTRNLCVHGVLQERWIKGEKKVARKAVFRVFCAQVCHRMQWQEHQRHAWIDVNGDVGIEAKQGNRVVQRGTRTTLPLPHTLYTFAVYRTGLCYSLFSSRTENHYSVTRSLCRLSPLLTPLNVTAPYPYILPETAALFNIVRRVNS